MQAYVMCVRVNEVFLNCTDRCVHRPCVCGSTQSEAGGDEFMAVKPWLGAIVEPTIPPAVNPTIPEDELHLRWVHGYRSLDSRNNLRYTAKGELV